MQGGDDGQTPAIVYIVVGHLLVQGDAYPGRPRDRLKFRHLREDSCVQVSYLKTRLNFLPFWIPRQSSLPAGPGRLQTSTPLEPLAQPCAARSLAVAADHRGRYPNVTSPERKTSNSAVAVDGHGPVRAIVVSALCRMLAACGYRGSMAGGVLLFIDAVVPSFLSPVTGSPGAAALPLVAVPGVVVGTLCLLSDTGRRETSREGRSR